MSQRENITILGVFVADATFRADRMPKIGETILGNSFALGPGGKGSNQAVAAARAGGNVHFVSRLGDDTFADMASELWEGAGVTPHVVRDGQSFTGAASIFVDDASGNNAIIISPGAASEISLADIQQNSALIANSAIFATQLEQPIPAALEGLKIAREGGAVTVLNPAPAATIPTEMVALCDYVTPNESEAEGITGISVNSVDDAKRAAAVFVEMGARAALITLGENGSYFFDGRSGFHEPAISAGPLVETTGAGDAFNGGFFAGLAGGMGAEEAVKFATATAAISVTRAGTAPSMPQLAEINELLKST